MTTPHPSSTQIFAQVEAEAYHACREWPLYLVLRERQLQQALALTQPSPTPTTGKEQDAS